MPSLKSSAATMRMETAFCWTTARSTLACSASAGTESTATISKMQSSQQIIHYTHKLCVRQAESNAKSASRSLYQRQRSSAIVRTVPQSKSGRKPPSASTENGRRFLREVSGRNPDELLICGNKQSARSDRARF